MGFRWILRGFGTLLLIGALLFVGVLAYNVGMARGLALEGDAAAPIYGPPHFPFFGVGIGLLFLFFGLPLLFFPLMGMSRWRRWGGHGWKHGGPPALEQWHQEWHQKQSQDREQTD